MWQSDDTEDIVEAHRIWFDVVVRLGVSDLVQEGNVIVTDTGSAGEGGFGGANTRLDAFTRGAVAIIPNGYASDTGELILQKTPVVTYRRSRPILPRRIMAVDRQVPIGTALGALAALALLVTRRASLKTAYTYAPYLVWGGLVALWVGTPTR